MLITYIPLKIVGGVLIKIIFKWSINSRICWHVHGSLIYPTSIYEDPFMCTGGKC